MKDGTTSGAFDTRPMPHDGLSTWCDQSSNAFCTQWDFLQRNVSSEEHGQHQPKHCWELTVLHRNSSERYHRLQGAGKVMTPFEGRKGKKEDCVVPAQGLLGTAFAFLYTGRNAFPFLLFIQFHRSLCSTALTAIAARQVRAASPAAQPPNQPPPDLKDLEKREGA